MNTCKHKGLIRMATASDEHLCWIKCVDCEEFFSFVHRKKCTGGCCGQCLKELRESYGMDGWPSLESIRLDEEALLKSVVG